MKIGMLIPAVFAVGSPGNGIRIQAEAQASALEKLGNQVVRMDAWESYDLSSFDVIQFYLGGFAHYGIHDAKRRLKNGILVFAPIIDSNEHNMCYRVATRVGGFYKKVFTIPGVFRQQAVASDVVICRSRHERERVVKGLGIPSHKAEIVLNGVPLQKTEMEGISLADGEAIPSDFIFHASAFTQERKNVVRLIDAIGPLGIPLLIAGYSEAGEVLNQIHGRLERYSNVKVLPFLSRGALNWVLARCRVFALPSIHEGTGLAALEAASFGANIVITRRGGTSDYFGEYAEYVDPYSVDSIQRAVVRAWNKVPDHRLRDYVVSRLTWDESAKCLLAVYERYLAQ